MSRAERLLDLIQILRRHRRPVSGAALAAELGVSLRTLYRDVETLQGQGADIAGEAGLGYVLRPGFTLPPLMFTADELDAVILGLRFAMRRGDDDLGRAAANALAKVEAVLPAEMEDAAAASALLAGPGGSGETPHLGAVRAAIRAERKLRLDYVDKRERSSRRTVWPIAIGFFTGSEVLAAWCETRGDFRHFRLDRIRGVETLPERPPRRHRILLAEWRLEQDLDDLG